MRSLHRPSLSSWAVFDEARNVDFNGTYWAGSQGRVMIDPVRMSAHDEAHLESLGGADWVVVTNSDHVRETAALAKRFGAKVAGPSAERDGLGIDCERWLCDGDVLVPGFRVLALEGSKTPGELLCVIEEHTVVTGDLIRGQRGGALNLLPDAKLADAELARASVKRLLALSELQAVLVGDGWSVFSDGARALRQLCETL